MWVNVFMCMCMYVFEFVRVCVLYVCMSVFVGYICV